MTVEPRPLPAAPLVVRHRYLAEGSRAVQAAPLAVRRRYLCVGAQAAARGAAHVLDCGAQAAVRGAACSAPRRYLTVEPKPLPAEPLVTHRRYLIVAPRSFLATPLVVRRRYFAFLTWPLPAAPLVERRRYLAVVPRSLPEAPRRCLSIRRKNRQMSSGTDHISPALLAPHKSFPRDVPRCRALSLLKKVAI
jgi:hypothetical protein